MRAFIGAVAILIIAGAGAAADEKIDAKKLIGHWEEKTTKDDAMVLHFTKDGKFSAESKAKDKKDHKFAGTYTVEGKDLILDGKFDDMAIKFTVHIEKLTDDEMVGVSAKNKESKTFVRVKDKK
jgi:uncharacterized protein (TIGR03066 family)